MGANAQTSVPAFTSGQVLTAAQMTQVNTGIPVFASSTERDAAFGGTGEKTLAEGQMAYLEDTNETQVYDGSAWAALGGSGGLVFITKSSLSGSSVSFDNVFDSTYENYVIVVSDVSASASVSMYFRLRAASSDAAFTRYYWHQAEGVYASSTYSGRNGSGQTYFYPLPQVQGTSTDVAATTITVYQPALAKYTGINYDGYEANVGRNYVKGAGFYQNTTVFDGFSLVLSSGTFSSGNCFVYGLATS